MRKKRSEEIEYKEEEADKKSERDISSFRNLTVRAVTAAPSFFLVLVSPFAFRTQTACCVLADFKEEKEKEDSEREIAAIKGVVGSRL